MPNLPAIDFDITAFVPVREVLAPIVVYVNADLITAVAGCLLSIAASKPSAEHLRDINEDRLRTTNETIRAYYTSVALDLIAREQCMPVHDDILTVLQTGARNFTSEYDSALHTWTITLTLPDPIKGDTGDIGPIGPIGPQGLPGADCSSVSSVVDENEDCECCE